MLARLKQMLIKEFIQVFRDKRTRFVLFGPPIIQMMILDTQPLSRFTMFQRLCSISTTARRAAI